MGRGIAQFCIILSLGFGLTSCETPVGKSQLEEPKYLLEDLGVLGEPSIINLRSYGLSAESDPDTDTIRGHAEVSIDFATGKMNFDLYCKDRSFTGVAPLPRSLNKNLESLITTAKVCELRYEWPVDSDQVRCMAMVIPMAEIRLKSGESVNLVQAGDSLCHQTINFFCDPEVEAKFIKLSKEALALVPSCGN